MTLVDRVKNICLTPATEWPVIAEETTPAAKLVTEYVVPLAAVGAVAGFIGGSLVGRNLGLFGTYRVPIATGLGLAVFTFVMAIVGVFILSIIINALAPNFGGQKDSAQALKVAVYSYTPAWVAGILQILPTLGLLAVLGALYGLYLLYLGLPRLMKCPEDKAITYTGVVVVCAIVLSVVIGGVASAIGGVGALGVAGIGGAAGAGGSADVQFDPDSQLGQLQQLGQQLEQSGRDIEAAQQSGDPDAQAAAAVNALGTLLGGGARVEPLALDQIRPFVPETFAGLPRTSTNAERTGFAGIMIARAEATYDDGAESNVTLEVQDTGGVSGVLGLVGWIGVEEEREDDFSVERTERIDGRLVREKQSKTGGAHEYGVGLGERFIVSATGRGVSLDDLKSAVSSLDLATLESMSEAGADANR